MNQHYSIIRFLHNRTVSYYDSLVTYVSQYLASGLTPESGLFRLYSTEYCTSFRMIIFVVPSLPALFNPFRSANSIGGDKGATVESSVASPPLAKHLSRSVGRPFFAARHFHKRERHVPLSSLPKRPTLDLDPDPELLSLGVRDEDPKLLFRFESPAVP